MSEPALVTEIDSLIKGFGFGRKSESSWLGRCIEKSCRVGGARVYLDAGYQCSACGLHLEIGPMLEEFRRRVPDVVYLSEVRPVEVSWLWPNRIPLGRLTILDGDPGLGKSTVTLDIAARVTRGSAMPDGLRGLDGPRGVVLMGVEDGLDDTVRPRLDAAGGDPHRVVALKAVRDDRGNPRLPTIADVNDIEYAARQVDAALIVIDPLTAFMGKGVDSHKDADVRQALADLAELAQETGLANLVVRHLNKSGGTNPLYRGGGSIGIIAAARSGMLLAPDPIEDDALVLAPTKSNLAAPQPSLGLRLVRGAGLQAAQRVEWTGVSERSVQDLLHGTPAVRRRVRGEAQSFLRDELAGGVARAATELVETAKQAGISRRTLERAKKELGVEACEERDSEGRVRGWVWRLPVHPANGVGGLDGDDLVERPVGRADSSGSEGPEGQAEDLAAWKGGAYVEEEGDDPLDVMMEVRS